MDGWVTGARKSCNITSAVCSATVLCFRCFLAHHQVHESGSISNGNYPRVGARDRRQPVRPYRRGRYWQAGYPPPRRANGARNAELSGEMTELGKFPQCHHNLFATNQPRPRYFARFSRVLRFGPDQKVAPTGPECACRAHYANLARVRSDGSVRSKGRQKYPRNNLKHDEGHSGELYPSPSPQVRP